jgi:hypothetical protein
MFNRTIQRDREADVNVSLSLNCTLFDKPCTGSVFEITPVESTIKFEREGVGGNRWKIRQVGRGAYIQVT